MIRPRDNGKAVQSLLLVQSSAIVVTDRPAIAGNPRCSVLKLRPKYAYNCEKRASNIALSYCVDVDK